MLLDVLVDNFPISLKCNISKFHTKSKFTVNKGQFMALISLILLPEQIRLLKVLWEPCTASLSSEALASSLLLWVRFFYFALWKRINCTFP